MEILKIPENILKQHALAAEFAEVCRNPLEGIFVSPSARESNLWYGVIFVRKGIFGGGIFRFKLRISEEFPDSNELPKLVFDSSIFHPLIDSKNRELCLDRSFPDGWKKEKHSLRRVLVVLQRSFYSYDVDTDKCINPEASVLFKEHRDKFREIAKECVENSRAMVYDEMPENDDPNMIRLLPWDNTTHQAAREKMLEIGKSQKFANSAAEFRRENIFRPLGISVSEIVGKNYPRSYSWFDPKEMTVITKYGTSEDLAERIKSPENSARLDREKHGIERLDLSVISINESDEK